MNPTASEPATIADVLRGHRGEGTWTMGAPDAASGLSALAHDPRRYQYEAKPNTSRPVTSPTAIPKVANARSGSTRRTTRSAGTLKPTSATAPTTAEKRAGGTLRARNGTVATTPKTTRASGMSHESAAPSTSRPAATAAMSRTVAIRRSLVVRSRHARMDGIRPCLAPSGQRDIESPP